MTMTASSANMMKNMNNRLHRSAIALNNMGVSFLRREYYYSAVEAFRKAYELMEYCNVDNNNVEEEVVGVEEQFAMLDSIQNKYIQLTSQNLARSTTTCQRRSVIANQENELAGDSTVILEINADAENDLETLQHAIHCCSGKVCTSSSAVSNEQFGYYYGLRIEDFDCKSTNTTNASAERFQGDCAIVLLNLGNSCFMYETNQKKKEKSRSKDRCRTDDSMYTKMQSICVGSYEIFSNCSSIAEGNYDIYQVRRYGLLTILVLQTLVKVSSARRTRCPVLITEICKELREIQSDISSYDSFCPTTSTATRITNNNNNNYESAKPKTTTRTCSNNSMREGNSLFKDAFAAPQA